MAETQKLAIGNLEGSTDFRVTEQKMRGQLSAKYNNQVFYVELSLNAMQCYMKLFCFYLLTRFPEICTPRFGVFYIPAPRTVIRLVLLVGAAGIEPGPDTSESWPVNVTARPLQSLVYLFIMPSLVVPVEARPIPTRSSLEIMPSIYDGKQSYIAQTPAKSIRHVQDKISNFKASGTISRPTTSKIS